MADQSRLSSLQAEARAMEVASRRFAQSEHRDNTRRQRQQIKRLIEENQVLRDEVSLDTARAKQSSTQTMITEITKAEDQCMDYGRRIQAETSKMESILTRINAIKEGLVEERKLQSRSNDANQEGVMGRHVRILENRLDKCLVKFNQAASSNTALKAQIDTLRRERSALDLMSVQMDSELQAKQAEMDHVVMLTNNAYHARDHAHAAMGVVQSEALQLEGTISAQFRALLATLEASRVDVDNPGQLTSTGMGNLSPHLTLSARQLTDEEEQLHAESQALRLSINAACASSDLLSRDLKSTSEAVNVVLKSADATSVDALVNEFTQAERENYQLFQELNEVSLSSEVLTESIRSLEKELHRIEPQQVDQSRSHLVQQFDQQLNDATKRTAMYEEKIESARSSLAGLTECIQSILRSLDDGEGLIPASLGVDTISPANITRVLAYIEQQAMDLLNKKCVAEQEPDNDEPAELTISAPSVWLSDHDDDDADEPL